MTTANILVVEDDKIIAKGIEKRLRTMGYAVAGLVSTGEEAVQKAAELHPDLILMDIFLGDSMDGVAAAGLIRDEVDLPVVYLTAYSDPATLLRAKITQPFGYVLKPYEDRDLQTAIEIGLYKHKQERRLRENEQWLAAMLGSMGDGVIATDEQGRVRFMNGLAEQHTGWTLKEATGKDIQEVCRIVDDKSRQSVKNPAHEALKKGEIVGPGNGSTLIGKSGGETLIDERAAPIKGANEQIIGAVLVFRDISELCRVEENLRQAQKMEAIGHLAGGIAHDFNNILTIIIGSSELLLASEPSADPKALSLRSIYDAAMRAAALAQQIMSFSRTQKLMPCVLNLNSVVRDMGAMVKKLLGSKIEFVTKPAPDLGQVKADPTQIGQAILNLAANAKESMTQGGQLVLITANAELGAETTRTYPDVKPGRYAMLSVRDTGSRMAQDALTHVFAPSSGIQGIGPGTKLLLATVHSIVKQSGGHIEISSQQGMGTEFRLYLPIVAEPAPSPEIHEDLTPAKHQETILLVEDEEPLRRMARTILTQTGYRVLEASNGLEGVSVAKDCQGPIHLLLTDLVMPKLSGMEMVQQLTDLKSGMRVLFMSGYSEDMILNWGGDWSSTDFLQKPFTLGALTQKVREVLDRPPDGRDQVQSMVSGERADTGR
jgi:two-component system, cell cycle sensor histidine kinase and response regulator CckA